MNSFVRLFLLLPLGAQGTRETLFYISLQFLNLRHSVGFLGRVISPSQGRYLTQTQNKHEQTSMPTVGFEPTIPVFERANTDHALDRAATVIGRYELERKYCDADTYC
jgi:hypothetical protein